MKSRLVLSIVMALSILFLGASSFAQPTMPPQGPRPHKFGPPPPPAATCTDGKHLYVVMGPKIHQYTIPDLKLQKTVELPRPAPPEEK